MSNPNFVPSVSTNEIWRDQDLTRCLEDDLDVIEADIAALETGKADTGHTHSGYAAASDVTNLQNLVGNTAVATQITTAVSGKADVGHTHTIANITDLSNELNSKYEKPSTGIPKTDLATDIQSSLNKADTAIQSLSGYATETYVNTQVSSLVDSAPETLNTLNELAAALGDDPNFATTIATQIGTKVTAVEGKGLSTNDYTNAEKTKLAGIETGANKTIVDSALSTTSTNPVQNKVVKSAYNTLNQFIIEVANDFDAHTHDRIFSSDGMTNILFNEDDNYYYFRPNMDDKILCGSNANPWHKVYTNRLEVLMHRITCLPTYENTVSYATNMYVGTAGVYSRTTNTSSRTVKHDIQELQQDNELSADNLYDVGVYQFKYNDGIITDENDARYGQELVGFIIEDLDEKYPIAVDKPEDDVKTWSWNAQYMIPPMLKLIQEQKLKIDELESRIEVLEA